MLYHWPLRIKISFNFNIQRQNLFRNKNKIDQQTLFNNIEEFGLHYKNSFEHYD